jgi:aminoglycoside/choline kinase family phosphotransferase
MKVLKEYQRDLRMLDKVFIEKAARNIAGINGGTVNIDKIKGDASNRSYYRISFNQNKHTMILMELAEPEAFKKAEEKVTVSAIPVTELPYINILNHLAKCNVSVPKLFLYEKERGLLFLEDLGDETLHERIERAGINPCMEYYKKAIDELIKIHACATRIKDNGCIAFGRAFDTALLMWEFDHFIEYGIEDAKGVKIPENDRRAIRDIFYSISERLAKEQRVFTHRDFHSRNLMIHNDKISVLDFQDALMGPCQYDLASLLRDSYIALPEEMIDELMEYYISKKKAVDGAKIDRRNFSELFDLMSIQRNLKAAGRFAYINSVKKNNFYLQFIPQTLGYVRKNLKKYSELNNLRELLGKYVEELR